MQIFASRHHDFSAGHRVVGHEGKCRHLHGHNYRVTFICSAPQADEIGRVIDFGVIKATMCQWLEDHWDHRMLIWKEDPIRFDLLKIDSQGIATVPFNPTAENMAAYLLHEVGPSYFEGTDVTLRSVLISETRKCSAGAEL